MQITTAKLKNADGSFEYLGIGADANYITLKNGENFEGAASEVNNNTSNMDLTYQILDKELKTSIPVDVELNRNIAEFSSRDPQTNVIKTNRAKVKNEDGWSEDIPIAAAAVNIDLNNGNNAEDTFENLEVKLNKLNEKYDELKSLVPKVSEEGDVVTIENADINDSNFRIEGGIDQINNILPDEYQQIEYIESTGTQYIDTGFKPNQDTRIESKMYTLSSNNSYNVLFGVRGANDTKQFFIGVQDNGTEQYEKYTFFERYDSQSNWVKLLGVKVGENIIDFNKNICSINGINYTFEQALFQSELNMYIFANNHNGNVSRKSYLRLYSFKIYDNDILVRDFTPCYRKSDNEIGLYDTVNNVFYTNQGTSTFIKGNNVSIPNPEYPQDIDVVTGDVSIDVTGKNLLKIDNIPSSPTNGITVTKNGENIVLNGTPTINYCTIATQTKCNWKKGTYSFLSSGGYGESVLARICIRVYFNDGTNKTYYGNTTSSKITFEITQNVTSYSVFCDMLTPGNEYTNVEIQMQLELGSQATEYEVPILKTHTLSLGEIELVGNDNMGRDYLWYDNKNKRWYKHNVIKKTVFTGREAFVFRNINSNHISTYSVEGVLDRYPKKSNICGFSNLFTDVGPVNSVSSMYLKNIGFALYYNYTSSKNLTIIYINSSITNLDDFKSWLVNQYNIGNPLIIYSPLEENTDELITDEILLKQLNDLLKDIYQYDRRYYMITDNKNLSLLKIDYTQDLEKKVIYNIDF